jgi:YVTN family beta-propeller protein
MTRQLAANRTRSAVAGCEATSLYGGKAIAKGIAASALAFIVALSSTFAAGPDAVLTSGNGGVVYTADEYGNSISAIDLESRQVKITPIGVSPHNIQISADGTRLFAVGSPPMHESTSGHSTTGHDEMSGGQLLTFDTTNLSAGPISVTPIGEHPAHVVVDAAGLYAFVSLSGENTVAVVDLKKNELVRSVGTGAFPHGLRISPDRHEIYVANVKDNSVSVLDTTTLTELKRIPVGVTPVQVGFVPDGSRVYVSLRDANSVAVIDTKTRSVISTIEVGRNPIQVHSTPDGRSIYVANQGTEDNPNDTVSVIDTSTNAVVATIHVGKGAHGVTVSADGAYVFVSNIVDGTVSQIASDSQAVVDTIAVGKGPNGITFQNSGE